MGKNYVKIISSFNLSEYFEHFFVILNSVSCNIALFTVYQRLSLLIPETVMWSKFGYAVHKP